MNNTKKITILGGTGDLGSQLACYLNGKRHKVSIFIRKGNKVKFDKRTNIKTSKKISVIELATIFDQENIKKILSSSSILFYLAGLVSLSFKENIFPNVLLVNGFYLGILSYFNRRYRAKIIYPSTQRMQKIVNRTDIKQWINIAVTEFQLEINNLLEKDQFESTLLAFIRNFLHKNPIPKNVNIYELSKALGEAFLKIEQAHIILRISSCYGPGCSMRRTVGRFIFFRLLGKDIVEKKEIRDYIYINDLNAILEKTIFFNNTKPYVRYCVSGERIKTETLFRNIVKYTPDGKGKLKFTMSKSKEVFTASKRWMEKKLGKQPTTLMEGLKDTTNVIREKYFLKSQTEQRLYELYDQIQKESDENGILPEKINFLKENFFSFKDGKWIADDALWKPTGIIIGYPLPKSLTNAFLLTRNKLISDLNLSFRNYWLQDYEKLHITVVSYSHYSEQGKNLKLFPSKEISKAKNIVSCFQPIDINFNGTVITSDGSILIKGYVKDESLFELRERLKNEIDGITKKQQNLVHTKIGQILNQVPYEKIADINRHYSSCPLIKHAFGSVKVASGEELPFKTIK